jgi:hypothetical protein
MVEICLWCSKKVRAKKPMYWCPQTYAIICEECGIERSFQIPQFEKIWKPFLSGGQKIQN